MKTTDKHDIALFLQEKFPKLTASFIDKLTEKACIKKYAPSEFLAQEGEPMKDLSFLCKGIVHSFSDWDGITINMYSEYGMPFLPVSSDDFGSRSLFNYQWLTEGECISIDNQFLNSLTEKHPKEIMYMKVICLEQLNGYLRILCQMQRLNPEKKYLWLEHHYPNYLTEVSHYHVAEFLNITPTSLSRIRARLGRL